MARAEVYFEDNGPNADVRFVYPDGFDKNAPSHQMSNILRQLLDQHFAPVGERVDVGDMSVADAELATLKQEKPLVIEG